MDFYEKEEMLWRSSVDRNPNDALSQRKLAWCFGRRGVVSVELGRTSDAVEFFQKGLDIYQRLVETDPNNTSDGESLVWYIEQIKATKLNK